MSVSTLLLEELSGLEGTEFERYLRERLTAYDERIRLSRDEVDVRWMQGRAQELSAILGDIRDAQKKIREMRDAAKKTMTRRPLQGAF